MHPEVRICPFDERYRDGLLQMMQEINDEFSLPPHHPHYRRREPDHCWLAVHDGKVVGSVAMLIQSGYAVLKRMFVLQNFRGKESGLATALLETALAQCRALKIPALHLGTLDVLKAAQRFYAKSGFVRTTLELLPPDFPHNLSDNLFYTIHIQASHYAALHTAIEKPT